MAAHDLSKYLPRDPSCRSHVVPPYVLRAVPSATVSTPLKWTELTSRLKPERFDLKTAPKRFERQKRDPDGSVNYLGALMLADP
jgi:DNA primase